MAEDFVSRPRPRTWDSRMRTRTCVQEQGHSSLSLRWLKDKYKSSRTHDWILREAYPVKRESK